LSAVIVVFIFVYGLMMNEGGNKAVEESHENRSEVSNLGASSHRVSLESVVHSFQLRGLICVVCLTWYRACGYAPVARQKAQKVSGAFCIDSRSIYQTAAAIAGGSRKI
jgi:hypothetical protein